MVVTVGDVEIDLERRRVTKAGQLVHLTPTELALLRQFAISPGVLLTHATLLRRVWGTGYETRAEYTRVYVGRLRAKLESADGAHLFITEPRSKLPVRHRVTGSADVELPGKGAGQQVTAPRPDMAVGLRQSTLRSGVAAAQGWWHHSGGNGNGIGGRSSAPTRASKQRPRSGWAPGGLQRSRSSTTQARRALAETHGRAALPGRSRTAFRAWLRSG